MVTRDELKELLGILNFYLIVGLLIGVVTAVIAINGGIVLTSHSHGASPAKAITASILLGIGAFTGLSAYLVLLPAELKLVRRKLRPKVLRQRLAGKNRRNGE